MTKKEIKKTAKRYSYDNHPEEQDGFKAGSKTEDIVDKGIKNENN